MEEIWKDVPGFEGVYKVSNLGNVISVSYRHTGIPKILNQGSVAGILPYIGVAPAETCQYIGLLQKPLSQIQIIFLA